MMTDGNRPRSETADEDWARSDALLSSRPMTIEVQHPPPAASSTSPVTPTWPSGMMAAPSSLRSHFYPTNPLQYHGGHGEGSGNNGRPFIRADPYVQGLIHIYSGTNQHIMMYGRPVLEPGASYDPYLSEYFENEDAIAGGRSPQQGGFSRRNRLGDQGQVQGPMQGQNSASNSSGGEMQGMRIRSGATSRTGNRDYENERTATTTTTASSGSRTNESMWVAPGRNDINNASGIGQLGGNSSFSHSSSSHSSGGSGTRGHPRLMSSPTSRQFPSASFAPLASLDEITERDRPSRLSQYQSAKEQDRAPQERNQEKITTPSLDLDPTLSSPSGLAGEEEALVQSRDSAETEILTTVLTTQ
ncbi:hypothetical protein BGW38_008144 [Lunasporangiospora selenospora]|uniref:Uncharacterized protein n=1 Tax=Lunasporangiospora selenospora TaxID=979761 RepID=A0A9P6KGE0_9FUNG|nr:hypothetical protein BGW38_008144 [Lunasporangiospora selenospora]